jgi:hypothetical protein
MGVVQASGNPRLSESEGAVDRSYHYPTGKKEGQAPVFDRLQLTMFVSFGQTLIPDEIAPPFLFPLRDDAPGHSLFHEI